MNEQRGRGPRFVRFFPPLLEALKQLDGSGMPDEVKNLIAAQLEIPEAELLETLDSGQGRVSNSIDWARFYLSKAGYIDGSNRGRWTLTEIGWNATLTPTSALALFKKVHRKYRLSRKRKEAHSGANGHSARPKLEIQPMPRKVARRIMVRCAKGEKVMVVVAKQGKPTSIYGLEEYLKKRQLQISAGAATPTRPTDALPKVKAGTVMPLKREHYYE